MLSIESKRLLMLKPWGGQPETMTAPPAATAGGALSGMLPWPRVDFAKFGPVERRDLSRIKKISGADLHRNWVMIPHVTNHEDADITELEAFRVQINKEHEKAGIKVTMLAFLVKACVAALKKFPEFNASLDGEQIVLKQYYNIGFAADTPNGLVVPVIKDADKKGILAIATEMGELAAMARDGKLSPADMTGGCFSISSLGRIGGTNFTPIINAPEVAILGVCRSNMKPVWDGESFVPRLILPLSLSWDHRVIDGALGRAIQHPSGAGTGGFPPHCSVRGEIGGNESRVMRNFRARKGRNWPNEHIANWHAAIAIVVAGTDKRARYPWFSTLRQAGDA